MDEIRQSELFYNLRAFAILSVAYAHALDLQNVLLARVGALLGLIGVPVFLICSGYYYKPVSLDKNFFYKKFQTIVAPWLIWGTFAFILTVILNDKIQSGNHLFTDYLLYLSGYHTWLYFVPIYLITIFLFQWIKPSRGMLFLSMGITAISCCITFFFKLDFGITPFQNPLNWIGFYAMGICLKNHLDAIIQKKMIFWSAGILSVVAGVYIVLSEWTVSYWHPASILFELSAFGLLLLAAYGVKGKFFGVLGMNSYVLYFLHMQLGIASANVIFRCLPFSSDVATFGLKPSVVILISMFYVWLISLACKRLGLGNGLRYLGIKW